MRAFRFTLLLTLFMLLQFHAKCEEYIYCDQGGASVYSVNDIVGLISSNGEHILPARFDIIEPFLDNMYTRAWSNDKCGVIDKSGHVCIECEWDDITLYPNVRLAKCENYDDYNDPDITPYSIFDVDTGHILRLIDGEEIVRYRYFFDTEGEYAYNYVRDSERAGFYTTQVFEADGVLVKEIEGFLHTPTIDGYSVISLDGEAEEVLDDAGNVILQINHGYIRSIEDDIIYYMRYALDGDAVNHASVIGGIADREGILLEIPNSIVSSSGIDGLFIVKERRDDVWDYEIDERGVYRYVNAHGDLVIPGHYDYATPFYQGTAAVCTDDIWCFIDENGNQVGNATWEYPSRAFSSYIDPIINHWSMIPVGLDDSIQLVNRNGEWLDDDSYSLEDAVGEYPPDVYEDFLYLRNEDGALCFLTSEGLSPFIQFDIESFITPRINDASWWVCVDGLWGCLDLDSQEMDAWKVKPVYRGLEDLGTYLWVTLEEETTAGVFMSINGEWLGPGYFE